MLNVDNNGTHDINDPVKIDKMHNASAEKGQPGGFKKKNSAIPGAKPKLSSRPSSKLGSARQSLQPNGSVPVIRGIKRKPSEKYDGNDQEIQQSNEDDPDESITRVDDKGKPKKITRERNSTGNLHLVKNRLSDKETVSGKRKDEKNGRFNTK